MSTKQNYARIPQPPEKFLFDNLLDLSATSPVQDMVRLAREYGPIYRLDMRGRAVVVLSGHELVDEVCDEKRFDKSIRGALRLVRRFGGDGLFTSKTQEPNWSKAHNILLPNFGHRAMQSYHPMMLDIAEQLVLKWERMNPEDEIDVAGDMTRLTVDTIGLCGFDYRLNSFYQDGYHPFVSAMANALGITLDELRDVPLEKLIRQGREQQLKADVRCMNEIVDRIIADRKASGDDLADKPDLLSYMLSGVDKKTGERLDDLNIRYQVITFLIAGHETTSGLLAFAIYALLNNPEVLAKAYEEVDRVFGHDLSIEPTYSQVNRLNYVTQILKETLRLWPTAPAFMLYPYETTMIGGKYRVKRTDTINVLLPMLHRDKSIWGEDAEVFNPDNFTAEAEARRPANAYKPFGNGQRACIGRQFALQEATLVLGMILQRFEFVDHANYQLKIKESLTIKPEGLTITVRPRSGRTWGATPRPGAAPSTPRTPALAVVPADRHGTPLLVLFGSNLGGSEDIASRIAREATDRGYTARTAGLDSAVG